MRPAATNALLLIGGALLFAGCDTQIHPEEGIFSQPVEVPGLGSNLPSLEEEERVYKPPTFRNSDGSVSRVLWLEAGMAEKMGKLLVNHPDWKRVKATPTGKFFEDPNGPATKWDKFTGTEGLLLTGTTEDVDKVTDLVGWVLSSPAKISIEARIVEVLESDETGFGADWFILNQDDQGRNFFGDPLASTHSVFNRGKAGRGIPPLPGVAGGSTTNFIAELGTIAGDIQIDLVIQALKAFTKVDVVNAPNVAVNDGYSATISAGQQIPFFEPVLSGNNTTITTRFKDVSVQLQVIPRFIPPNMIRLTVSSAVKNVTDVSTVTFSTNSTVTNPVIAERAVTTTLDVPDGGTVVLGGLITNTKIEVEEKVPLLGEIPIVNFLFSNRHKQDLRNNLIFFLRPKLLQQGATTGGTVIVPPEPGEMPGRGDPDKDKD